MPYTKGSDCITFVNRNIADEIVESDWISFADFKSLQIVSDDILQKDVYISVKTRPKFVLTSWNRISIVYDITATANDLEAIEVIAQYRQKREMIFVFSNFKWVVESVKSVQ